jgi:alpha-1,3-mannosyltransferase
MLQFQRLLRRRINFVFQGIFFLFVALSIITGFRHLKGNPSVETGTILRNHQSFPLKVSSQIPSPTSSHLLKPASLGPSLVFGIASPKPSATLETESRNKSATIGKASSELSSIPETVPAQSSILLEDGNSTLLESAPAYVKSIMTPEDNFFPKLACPPPSSSRYEYLRHMDSNRDLKYFFALNLHQSAKLLPRLVGSIVETIRFLGLQGCALSIVDSRSDDGTFEILQVLRKDLERIGITYYFNSSDIDLGADEAFAKLRNPEQEPFIKHPERYSTNATMNLVLEPLMQYPKRYSTSATVIFLNGVSVCMEDILELIHQRIYQGADMTCPMDWTFGKGFEHEPTFYDVWVARGMTGDSFFNIPIGDETRGYAKHLLWNDPMAQRRLYAHRPFQVFSCWSSVVVFTAKPLLEQMVRFRRPTSGECLQGEPQLFCKDMWYSGYGKIATVPSVNIEYSNEAAKRLKELKGYTSHWVKEGREDEENHLMQIEWEEDPPPMTKCYQGPWTNQTWVPWDEFLPEAAIENGAQGMYKDHYKGPQSELA